MTLSVIVPCRNAAETLPRCLDAIQRHGGAHLELVVIDDGSTDESGEIAEQRGAVVIRMDEPQGPAVARNAGAKAATGDVLLFVDADVVLAPDAMSRVRTTFDQDPGLAAMFGSYDASPAAGTLVSDYRNLLHHFTHQRSLVESQSFWAGCGAVRRSVFLSVDGFDEGFRRPSIEDIEFGWRVSCAGHRIRLDKQLLGTHLKRWTLGQVVRVDILDRAYPWSRLILERRAMRTDLNLQAADRASAVLVWTAIVAAVVAPVVSGSWQLFLLTLVGLSLTAAAWLNRGFYQLLFRRRGGWFVVGAFWLHMLYYAYASATFGWAWFRHRLSSASWRAPVASRQARPRIEPRSR